MANAAGLVVEPMGEDLFLWRCLHGGLLNPGNIEHPPAQPDLDWKRLRARNLPLLEKLTRTYGACAMVARDGADIIATLRFYPKPLCVFSDAGGAGFCLQQEHPAGPAVDLAERDFPPLFDLPDQTLFVHCMLIVSPGGEPGRFRRRGLATRMAGELIRWAREKGWKAIEATAYEEIPWLYSISGVAGRRFWERLGFVTAASDTEPGMKGEILETVRKEAVAAGIPAARAADRYRMRLDLT